ncbi:MAG TPA: hypothetical protein VFU13_00820 [Steroidobacteraceae bacterium]|nr:hypothetical protein [Steroidobacteraceae bacterium]
MKTDWVAAGFTAMHDCGDDISIVYAEAGTSPRAEPHWFELPHDKFDGVSGLAHLLREQGLRLDSLPVLAGDRPSWRRTLRGLLAVFPALQVRRQKWRRFDHTRTSTFRRVRDRVASRLFTEAQTREIVAAARDAGVTVNTWLLSHLDRAVAAQLAAPSASRLWMIPVNLRGALPSVPENFLQMSFLPVDIERDPSPVELQALINGLRQRDCHWGTWTALHLGRLIGHSGIRRELRKRAAAQNGWAGIFSNLGVWNVPGARSWIFGPAISRAQPVGAGCLTMNGRMSLTIQLHEALTEDLQASYALLDAWAQGCLKEPLREQFTVRRRAKVAVS